MSETKKTYDLSVVIVNYNVVFFLEQCLNSVKAASKNLKVEIFVVDNNSVDGSVELVKEKFPEIILIENKVNTGFSKANNQAILNSKGRYVLLLNPDTVVEEDTFDKTVKFMDQQSDAGGLGVRMIDGKGKFLPESKRGFPSPAVAFFKIFGLSRLFPKSKFFGKYHLGYLSEFETNEVDVLSGAFMLMRKETLDKVGLLDETFFMYGEDIDLSYRITLGGYKNYYFPETKIIHYKGESTKKSSVNYVFVFYNAMIIFAKKHFSQQNAKLFSLAINLAIYFRASAAILNRFLNKISLPFFDYVISLLGLFALANRWAQHDIHFPDRAYYVSFPFYLLIWLTCNILSGLYDNKNNRLLIWQGTFMGTAIILICYALLPKEWQFSRLFTIIGSLWYIGQYYLSRLIINLYKNHRFSFPRTPKKRFAIVGNEEEFKRVEQLLTETYPNIESIIAVSASKRFQGTTGDFNQISEIITIHRINELIFCSKNLSAKEIISGMANITNHEIEFKIAQPETTYLIGSNSIDSSGDLYILNSNNLSRPENIRAKRILDLFGSLFFILTTPVLIWAFQRKKKLLNNLFNIFRGKKSFVGYIDLNQVQSNTLPSLKPGILNPYNPSKNMSDETYERLNLLYAKNFSLFLDLQVIFANWKKLDQ
jgi:GT2 family glycosyltransferase